MNTISGPQEARLFSEAVSEATRGGNLVAPGGSGVALLKRTVLGVTIPIELAEYLPTGLETPSKGDVTVAYPVDGETDVQYPPVLKLSWEYNPEVDAAAQGDWEGARIAKEQRGWPLTMWQARSEPQSSRISIDRASGFMDQLPTSFYGDVLTLEGQALKAKFEESRRILTARRIEAERIAWQNAEAGITDPRVDIDEAAIVISFAQSLV